MTLSQSLLRQQGRTARQTLPPDYRVLASQQISEKLKTKCTLFTDIAVYLAMEEEVDLTDFIDWAFSEKKRVYVPIVQQSQEGLKRLDFYSITRGTVLKSGPFKIQEPESPRELDKIALVDCDFVCVPLVAFDERRNRIGMGSGLYDRALTECLWRSKRPFFMGCAFDCQKVPVIQRNTWDITLDGIITETQAF